MSACVVAVRVEPPPSAGAVTPRAKPPTPREADRAKAATKNEPPTTWAAPNGLTATAYNRPRHTDAAAGRQPNHLPVPDRNPDRAHIASADTNVASTAGVAAPSTSASIPAGMRTSLRLALGAWGLGAALLLFRLLVACRTLRRLRRRTEPLEARYLEPLRSGLRGVLGHRALPPIVTSDATPSPISFGFLRPLVVLPRGLAECLEPEQLQQIVAHEVAHVLRRDPWMLFLERFVGALFWPHVVVHALQRAIDRAREEICDNFVLRHFDPTSYSRTLLLVTEWSARRPQPSLAVGLLRRRKLETRIAGLLDGRRVLMTRPYRSTLISLVLGFTALSTLLLGAGVRPQAETSQPSESAKPRDSIDPDAVSPESLPAESVYDAILKTATNPSPEQNPEKTNLLSTLVAETDADEANPTQPGAREPDAAERRTTTPTPATSSASDTEGTKASEKTPQKEDSEGENPGAKTTAGENPEGKNTAGENRATESPSSEEPKKNSVDAIVEQALESQGKRASHSIDQEILRRWFLDTTGLPLPDGDRGKPRLQPEEIRRLCDWIQKDFDGDGNLDLLHRDWTLDWAQRAGNASKKTPPSAYRDWVLEQHNRTGPGRYVLPSYQDWVARAMAHPVPFDEFHAAHWRNVADHSLISALGGVQLQALTPLLRSQLGLPQGQGMSVIALTDDGTAAKSGLRANDIIIAVNGRSLHDANQLLESTRSAPEAPLAVRVVRDGARMKLSWRLPSLHSANVSAQITQPYWIGVGVETVKDTARKQLGLAERVYCYLSTVIPNSPAEKAGLQLHDIIISGEDGVPITNLDELRNYVVASEGKTLLLKVQRGGRLLFVSVTPEKPKTAQEAPQPSPSTAEETREWKKAESQN